MKQKKCFNQLVETLLTIKDRGEMVDFLKGILTPAELEEIPVRLEIVKRLIKGQSQREIARDLGVGVATVGRGARELKQGRFKVVRRLMQGRADFRW